MGHFPHTRAFFPLLDPLKYCEMLGKKAWLFWELIFTTAWSVSLSISGKIRH